MKIPQQRVEKMARLITVVWCAVAVLLCAAAGASWVEEAANPIRMVAGVEAEVVRVIGQCRRALKFARFMSRFGKSYRSEEEMRERYEIFSQNLRFIRSHNKNRLPYTLSVNRMSYLLFYFFFLSSMFLFLDFDLAVWSDSRNMWLKVLTSHLLFLK